MSGSAQATRLDDLLANAARDHGDRPALTDGEETVTYAALEAAAAEMATALSDAGVLPGDHVGVYLRKGMDAVTAIYAVLRLRAVAAPLDVSDPSERTARMVRNAALTFLITSHNTTSGAVSVTRHLGQGAGTVIRIGPALQVVALSVQRRATPHIAAGGYLLFTSGSTGWPKGVLLSHDNVLHFVRWAVDELGVKSSDRIGSQASLTFDLSTFDIFGASMSGACLSLMPDLLKAFPRDAVQWLADQRISIFYAVPTLYQALMLQGGLDTTALPHLGVIAFAGEPFPVGLLRKYVDRFEHAEFYNLYGPTETNVCTFEKVPAGWSVSDGLSVGRALPGLTVELVDDAHAVTASEGEIAVAGQAVFLGYLEDGDLHQQTTAITFDDGHQVQAYLTGDLGVRGAGGKIYLRGRRDHQIKRRGHRIDLRDIESVVQELPGVHSCAVVWLPEASEPGEIRLYVVVSGDLATTVEQDIATALPRRMAPDQVHVVDALPLTERGKIDREALVSMEPTRESDHEQRR